MVATHLLRGTAGRLAILGNSFGALVNSTALLQVRAITLSAHHGHTCARLKDARCCGDAQALANDDEEEEGDRGPQARTTPPLLHELCASGAVVEVPVPDCGAHGVAVSLHGFQPQRLSARSRA